MEHKHSVSSQPQMPLMDHDRMWSHPLPEHWVNLGPGCVMFPSEDFSAYGPNSLAYTNVPSTTNFTAIPNLNLVIPNYVRANMGMSQEPYMHYASACNSGRFPPYYAQHEICFNHLNAGDHTGTSNSSVDNETTAYKTNILTLQNLSDSTSTNAFYDASSFFNHPFSTGILDSRHNFGRLYHPWNTNSIFSGHRSNILLSSEEGQSKVRGLNTSVIHPGSISSGHFHSRATDSVLNVPGQQEHGAVSLNSHTNHLHTSEIGSFNHETDQFHGARHIDGGGNFCLPGQPTHDCAVDHNICEQRTNYKSNINQPVDFEANMVDIRLPAAETDVLQSPSREFSIVRHVNERNGGVVVMDRSRMYDSWNLFDENLGMRLDIDNMSYEELLALEEQIGNVNTGLSESAISECLSETIYSSNTIDSQEEVPCSICLESYKDVDCVGRLHCGHDFHYCCIKKWLLIKNVCPICKASAKENNLVEQ